MSNNIEHTYRLVNQGISHLLETMQLSSFKAEPIDHTTLSQYQEDTEFGFVIIMGPNINGAWAVSCSREFLKNSCKRLTNTDLYNVNDWQHEIVNLIMGSIKNCFLQYNAGFEVSSVMDLTQKKFIIACNTIAPIRGLSVSIDENSYFKVFFSLTYGDKINFSDKSKENKSIGPLGKIITFS